MLVTDLFLWGWSSCDGWESLVEWVNKEHEYPKVISPVLFHHLVVPKSQQAGVKHQELGGSEIHVTSGQQMCSLRLFGTFWLCFQ